eukprot:357126_1
MTELVLDNTTNSTSTPIHNVNKENHTGRQHEKQPNLQSVEYIIHTLKSTSLHLSTKEINIFGNGKVPSWAQLCLLQYKITQVINNSPTYKQMIIKNHSTG